MSIVGTAIKKWSGRTVDIGEDKRGLSDGYTVATDDVNTLQSVVVYAPGLPADGSPHDGDPNAYLTSRRARSLGTMYWEVELVYTGGGASSGGNPLLLPPKVRSVPVQSVEPIDVDLSGNPIINRASQRFDNEPTKMRSDSLVTVQRNKEVGSFSFETQVGYFETVNSQPYLGFAAGTGLMRGLEVTYVQQIVGGFAYWDVTAQIQFRRPPSGELMMPDDTILSGPVCSWFLRRLNAGLDELVFDSGGHLVLAPVIGKNGLRVSRPIPLTKLGLRVTNPIPANLVWLGWQVYPFVDFNALGLLT